MQCLRGVCGKVPHSACWVAAVSRLCRRDFGGGGGYYRSVYALCGISVLQPLLWLLELQGRLLRSKSRIYADGH